LPLASELLHRVGVDVVDHAFVAVLHQAPHHVGAHAAEADIPNCIVALLSCPDADPIPAGARGDRVPADARAQARRRPGPVRGDRGPRPQADLARPARDGEARRPDRAGRRRGLLPVGPRQALDYARTAVKDSGASIADEAWKRIEHDFSTSTATTVTPRPSRPWLRRLATRSRRRITSRFRRPCSGGRSGTRRGRPRRGRARGGREAVGTTSRARAR